MRQWSDTAFLPEKPDAPQRARGTGRVGVTAEAGPTRLAHLYQEGCAKIRLPRTHQPHLEAVLINTAGGLTGGDRLHWQAHAGAGSRLALTTPACEKAYRSNGDAAHIFVRLEVESDAHILWLPQETILFDRSRLVRTLEADLADSARLTALEAVIIGRDAMGEDAPDAGLEDQWRIRRGGRLVHAEATRLAPGDTRRGGPGLLAGNRAFATLVHLGADAEECLARVREALPDTESAAASADEGRLVVRLMARNGLALRRLIVPTVQAVAGPAALPRIWHI